MQFRDKKVALIAGASSNLGLNLAVRLLEGISSSTQLTLIVTSRTLPKVKEVISDIKKHALSIGKDTNLDFDYLLVDFADMVSVLAAYYELNKKYSRIDYVLINSAQGVYSGIDWIGACKEILAHPIEGVTNPTYKTQRVGVKSRDGLGLVFQVNVFGPYYLIYKIKHLLQNGGRVIWISSLMAHPKHLSFNDLQLLQSTESYEGSKRLVDLQHIGTYKKLKEELGIEQYVVEPGIFISYSFFQFLNFFTYYGMIFLFYLARYLGSKSHNISGYIAANAPIKCVLGDEPRDKKVGSACERNGKEYLIYHEIDNTGAEDVTSYLEKLRVEWDEKLKDQIVDSRKI